MKTEQEKLEMDNFDKWFEAQHGPRPHPHGKDAELSARINAGIEAEAMMRACDMYDAKRNSALYAWTANTYRCKRQCESEKGEATNEIRLTAADIGKRVRLRDGSVTTLIGFVSDARYPFRTSSFQSYTASGNFRIGGVETCMDIVQVFGRK